MDEVHILREDAQEEHKVDGRSIWVPAIPLPFFTAKGLPLWRRVSEKNWRPQCDCGRLFNSLEDYNAHIVYKNSPYAA